MISLTLVVVQGGIDKPHMEVQLGSEHYGICCPILRKFIQTVSKQGLCQTLEEVAPEEREMFKLLYEEFKDEI